MKVFALKFALTKIPILTTFFHPEFYFYWKFRFWFLEDLDSWPQFHLCWFFDEKRFLIGTKLLYNIWPAKLFFCTAILISFWSILMKKICKHSIFLYYWTKICLRGHLKYVFYWYKLEMYKNLNCSGWIVTSYYFLNLGTSSLI